MQKLKTMLVLLLTLGLAVLLSTAALADDATSGTCGENVTWSLEDGVLTISGEGEMEDYECGGAPWYSQRESITAVVIENGVASVGDCAFYYCDLTNATIGRNVSVIGDYAFSGCENLTSIIIPENVSIIGDWAFSDCYALKNLTISDGVTSIGEWAFHLCYELTSVVVPNSVTNIGELAFYKCFALTDIILSDNITTIADGMFAYDNLNTITIPQNVTSIGSMVFLECFDLTEIQVSAENTAFSSVDGVLFNKAQTELVCYPAGKQETFYTIPDGVTTLTDWAFSYCYGLTEIAIPNSVTSIETAAFALCTSLSDVYYSGSEAEWNVIEIGNYNNPLTSATIHYNSTGPMTLAIPEIPEIPATPEIPAIPATPEIPAIPAIPTSCAATSMATA